MVKSHNFVEVGRVCVINYGPDNGKLVTIIDIVDQARALVDGPAKLTSVGRQTIPLRNLSLTSIRLNIPRSVRTGTLEKAWAKENVLEQYAKTNWARKAARFTLRRSLSDFDRFRVMVLKKKQNRLVNAELGKLRRQQNKSKTVAKK